jgi:hypothetical protein
MIFVAHGLFPASATAETLCHFSMGKTTKCVVGIAIVDGVTREAPASSIGARGTGVKARVKGPC